jgi:hypothetical protein
MEVRLEAGERHFAKLDCELAAIQKQQTNDSLRMAAVAPLAESAAAAQAEDRPKLHGALDLLWRVAMPVLTTAGAGAVGGFIASKLAGH